jgi:hypothetical protein
METWSVFHTGARAHLVKRGLGEFDMQPNESEIVGSSPTLVKGVVGLWTL